MNGQEIVAIVFLASESEVRRTAVNNRVAPIEAADDEFVMDLMSDASNVRYLIEGRR